MPDLSRVVLTVEKPTGGTARFPLDHKTPGQPNRYFLRSIADGDSVRVEVTDTLRFGQDDYLACLNISDFTDDDDVLAELIRLLRYGQHDDYLDFLELYHPAIFLEAQDADLLVLQPGWKPGDNVEGSVQFPDSSDDRQVLFLVRPLDTLTVHGYRVLLEYEDLNVGPQPTTEGCVEAQENNITQDSRGVTKCEATVASSSEVFSTAEENLSPHSTLENLHKEYLQSQPPIIFSPSEEADPEGVIVFEVKDRKNEETSQHGKANSRELKILQKIVTRQDYIDWLGLEEDEVNSILKDTTSYSSGTVGNSTTITTLDSLAPSEGSITANRDDIPSKKRSNPHGDALDESRVLGKKQKSAPQAAHGHGHSADPKITDASGRKLEMVSQNAFPAADIDEGLGEMAGGALGSSKYDSKGLTGKGTKPYIARDISTKKTNLEPSTKQDTTDDTDNTIIGDHRRPSATQSLYLNTLRIGSADVGVEYPGALQGSATTRKTDPKRMQRMLRQLPHGPYNTRTQSALQEVDHDDSVASKSLGSIEGDESDGSYRGSAPRVIFASSTDIDKKAGIMKFLRSKHGQAVDYVADCNILVVGSGRLRRTSKMIIATLTGKSIVADAWLLDSMEKGKLLDVDRYYPKDNRFEREWKVDLLAAMERGRNNVKSLEGRVVYFSPALRKKEGPKLGELKEIALAAGATVSGSLPRNPDNQTVLLVDGPEDKDAEKFAKKGWQLYGRQLLALGVLRGGLILEDEEFKIVVED